MLDGQSVRALAHDYHLVPVALLGAGKATQSDAWSARLRAGDRLTAILALPDLQRLLQREPAPQDCAVELTECPPTARAYAAKLLGSFAALNADGGEAALDRLPLRLDAKLTRGQAEDLLELLRRERVHGRLCREEGQ